MIKSSYKKLDNGNLEIVFTISGDTVIETTQKVLKEIAKDVTVAGFRKGKAPIDKVKEAEALIPETYKALDKAAKKGAIHKKNAARRKSRLAKKINAKKTTRASK